MAKRTSHLRHAVTPPSLTQAQVPRPRLIEILNKQIDKKLILVAAPAGYGKTTLLAEFDGQAGVPVVWARLSEADQDAMRLATLVWSSLVKRFRRLRGALNLDGLAEASTEGLARAIASKLSERVSDQFVLVIDDVHLINGSEEARAFLRTLMDQLPPEACVVMAGREVPDIPLVKLIAQDDMATLSQDDLALDRTELEAVIERRLGELPEEQIVTRIANETEGWLTGVILSEVLLRLKVPVVPVGGTHPTYQYMASAAFEDQPQDVRRFMLGSAVFPVMTAAGCDVVLGRSDSQRMLNHLTAKGLFTSVTGTRPKTYEYHHQFRAFLLERGAEELGARLDDLRAKAAAWLEETGDIEEAVDLYLAADRLDEAADAASKAALLLASSGQMQSLARWVSEFRNRGVHLPKLYWAYGVALGDRGYAEKAIKWLRLARDTVVPSGQLDFYARLLWSYGRASLTTGRIDQALAAFVDLRTAVETSGIGSYAANLAQLEARIIWETTGDPRQALRAVEDRLNETELMSQSVYGFHNDCAVYAAALGDFGRAERYSREACERARQRGTLVSEMISLNNLANCRFSRGDFLAAEEFASMARDISLSVSSPLGMTYAEMTLAEIRLDLGLLAAAERLLNSVEEYARQIEDEDSLCYVFMRRAELALRSARVAEATALLEQCEGLDASPYDKERVAVTRLLLLSLKSPDEARSLLLSIPKRGIHLAESRAKCLFALSRSWLGMGDEGRAAFWLRIALDVSVETGVFQTLAAELFCDRAMLALAKRCLGEYPGFTEVNRRIDAIEFAAEIMGEHNSTVTPSTSQVHFRALGPGSVDLNGEQIVDLAPLHQEILFWLVDSGSVQAETLKEAYWSGLAPEAQAANLHTAIYRIRRVFGKEFVATDSGGYRVHPDADWSYDVRDFAQAVGVANGVPENDPRELPVLREAASLYRGEFLEGSRAGWAIARRAVLNGSFLGLAYRYAKACARHHQSSLALEAVQHALRLDPYHDGLNRVYLEALGESGRRYELVRHYRRYVQLLSDELGLDVPPQTAAAYERLIE